MPQVPATPEMAMTEQTERKHHACHRAHTTAAKARRLPH